ncbi:MAG: porin [Verrucomicrobiota bacterium]|nr:porin [Verrucomicrobiota bacterium]
MPSHHPVLKSHPLYPTLIALIFAYGFLAQRARAQEAMRAPAQPAFPATAPKTATPSTFGGSATIAEAIFGKDNVWDKTYDQIEATKEKWHFPISAGANHWFHIDRDERIYGNGYGVPTESGTYYYYVGADPSLTIGDGFIKSIGAHVQYRFRDDEHDKLRAFYSDTKWFYEAYATAKTSIGTFKAGQLVTEFGIPWDGTWWEGVPYFDGYKFDPDYGVSWDNTWKLSDRWSVDSAAQFFFASDGINGSIQGADAESALGLSERNTGVIRIVPTLKVSKDLKIAMGISGLYGGIKGTSRVPGTDDTRGVFGSDVTLTYKNFSVFAEYIDAFGATNPTRYVSGGPSDRVNSIRGGVSYKYGPVTTHVNYSRGWDHNPSGHQYVFNAGFNFQLTKNVVLYTEYVKWDVTDRHGITSKFDDGFELIAVWNL